MRPAASSDSGRRPGGSTDGPDALGRSLGIPVLPDQCDSERSGDGAADQPANFRHSNHRAVFATDTVTGAQNAALTSLFAGTYTMAAALQTALNTYLTANGGGSSVVTMASTGAQAYGWRIVITGAAGAFGLTALRTGSVLIQDGAGINNVALVGTNLP